MAETKPKMDLGAISAGVDLKHMQGTKPKGQDAALAHASAMNSINRQGEIAVPAERLAVVEKGQNSALARAGMLHSIGKQGVKEVNPEAVAKVEAARKAKIADLNAGKTAHINVVPGKEVKEEDIAAAKAGAAGLIASIGKAKPVLKHAATKQSNEHQTRAALLRTINEQGEKHAKPKEETGLHPQVARGAMLNSINKQGVVSAKPDAVAKVESARAAAVADLNKDKKTFFVIQEGKDDAVAPEKPANAPHLGDITKGVTLKPAETKKAGGELSRAKMLREAVGAASKRKEADLSALEAKGGAKVHRGAMLNSINKQGVIATPEESAAKVEADRAEKIAALDAAAKAEA
eukprot:CAMPEP_0205822570 /NCGR_PEP_ID=MMETSP0206-20130828/13081_1 /ASSEMBLY_ACC=CAM_ASM_000279 /TAXON_ID=36767 /ORGANISM="Euplotes focardii, Strain TN1" /LENGTH=348 /DNA_ID=CAMNT_0053118955 /DNA_START=31 /DNA_END=1077 /DNA_ORIENTATION=+